MFCKRLRARLYDFRSPFTPRNQSFIFLFYGEKNEKKMFFPTVKHSAWLMESRIIIHKQSNSLNRYNIYASPLCYFIPHKSGSESGSMISSIICSTACYVLSFRIIKFFIISKIKYKKKKTKKQQQKPVARKEDFYCHNLYYNI